MQYLQQTIRSIRNSANQNYQVIVAGNEEPELEGGFDGKLHFLSVNNQFPSHLDARAAQSQISSLRLELPGHTPNQSGSPNM